MKRKRAHRDRAGARPHSKAALSFVSPFGQAVWRLVRFVCGSGSKAKRLPPAMASAERERAPLSEVARIQLWREQIERERSRQKLRTSFGVDPRTLKTVTGKVQGKSLLSATPCASGPIEPRNAEEAAILHAIRELDMVPREKASFPRTAAEEIGWDTEPLEPVSLATRGSVCARLLGGIWAQVCRGQQPLSRSHKFICARSNPRQACGTRVGTCAT
jgi:hypothetical protein